MLFCCLVDQSCATLCDPMNCSMPGSPVLHYLLESAQIHVKSHWCCLTISSSAAPFSSCPQSFLASGSFPMSQYIASGGQRIGVSASTSLLPMTIQDWFPLGLTGLISLLSKGLSSLQHHSSKASILWHSACFVIQLSHPYMTTGKTITLTIIIYKSSTAK